MLTSFEAHAPIFGDPFMAIDLDSQAVPARRPPGCILVGLDRRGRLPEASEEFDLLLSAAPDGPRPWLALGAVAFAERLEALHQSVKRHPIAASMLCQVLRIGQALRAEEAMAVESFAYSALLGGREFAAWRARSGARSSQIDDVDERVHFTREGNCTTIELAHPQKHNAIDARMRDALSEALNVVADDPTVEAIHLRAQGRTFSVGGELQEFGTTPDLAASHAIRGLRSPALLLHRLGARVTAFVHGACIGSGIEIPAAAGRIVAQPDSWFSLPELSMGLIPGAGGTFSIATRLGRQRTLYWALLNRRMRVTTALAWGLIDEIREAP